MITAKKARDLANLELLEHLKESLIEINSLIYKNASIGELDISKYYQPLDVNHQKYIVNYFQNLGYKVIQQAGWRIIIKW